MYLSKVIVLLVLSQVLYGCCSKVGNQFHSDVKLPNLPASHLLRYLNTFPHILEDCHSSENCQLPENATNFKACWGYEDDCSEGSRFQTPLCSDDHSGWVSNKKSQVDTFYHQADFGYIQQQINELTVICDPSYLADSSLECTKYLRFCRGRNILFDFRDLLRRKELIRYDIDVLQKGQVLGHCRLNRTKLAVELDHMGALQSWAPELRNFDESTVQLPVSGQCDVIVDTPTFIMKIDAAYNMYHHFCDFFNLYASLFVNQTHPLGFDTDTRILIWESYPYDSPFAQTFNAFTHHPVWTLNDLKGKRVCFKNVVLPLLPRMIYGLFYNTPIIHGCQNSGLFRAFSEFVLHRLKIPFHNPLENNKLRITFLSRRTKYRQVLNEDDLIKEISANKQYHIQRVSYERSLSFTNQLTITRNTDILIGMHGAGLTHLLFLPDWASIFELYNCEDPNCYKDLARLRGVHYITWENPNLVYPQDEGRHPQGGAHAKFTNYSFDRKEFARLIEQAAVHVREHTKFKQLQQSMKIVNGNDEL